MYYVPNVSPPHKSFPDQHTFCAVSLQEFHIFPRLNPALTDQCRMRRHQCGQRGRCLQGHLKGPQIPVVNTDQLRCRQCQDPIQLLAVVDLNQCVEPQYRGESQVVTQLDIAQNRRDQQHRVGT
ncbi:hypothetical protein D3C74_399770 [compost metagenome]